MTVSKNHMGAWVVSDIIGNQFVERMYIGYNKREALRLFRADAKRIKNVRGFADAMKAYRIASGGF